MTNHAELAFSFAWDPTRRRWGIYPARARNDGIDYFIAWCDTKDHAQELVDAANAEQLASVRARTIEECAKIAENNGWEMTADQIRSLLKPKQEATAMTDYFSTVPYTIDERTCPQCGSRKTFEWGFPSDFKRGCAACKCEWSGKGIIKNGNSPLLPQRSRS